MSDIRKNLLTPSGTQGRSVATSFRSALKTRSTGIAKPDWRTSSPASYAAAAIGLIIDATASRNDTWREAKDITKDMLNTIEALGIMKLRLTHFGGSALQDHEWMDGAAELARIIERVRCENGPTQIVDSMKKYLEPGAVKADAIILIGDMFEESEGEAYRYADELALKGVKIFAFLEGNNGRAHTVFSELARRTGGAFSHFGAGMPLKDLCKAVAVYTAGGAQALQALAASSPAAANLLRLTKG